MGSQVDWAERAKPNDFLIRVSVGHRCACAQPTLTLDPRGPGQAHEELTLWCFVLRHGPDHFLESPVTLLGQSHLERLVLERNRLEGEPNWQVAKGTGQKCELSCGLLFRSVGYCGVPIPGVPFDGRNGVFPNADGRLLDNDRSVIPNLYVTGWIKRGPSGVIGTNRADSVATVNALLADLPKLDSAAPKAGAEALYLLLASRGIRVVSYADWLKIDRAYDRGRDAQLRSPARHPRGPWANRGTVPSMS
jgi:hypothetical protein